MWRRCPPGYTPPSSMSATFEAEPGRLNGWKEIALHLGKGARTVQRWEKLYGLPVHRLGREGGEIVFAFRDEIDRWVARTERERAANGDEPPGAQEAEAGGDPPGLPAPAPKGVEPVPALSRRRWAVAAGLLLLVAAGSRRCRCCAVRPGVRGPRPTRAASRWPGAWATSAWPSSTRRGRRSSSTGSASPFWAAHLRDLAPAVGRLPVADCRRRRGRPERGPGEPERGRAGGAKALLLRGGRPGALRPPADRHPPVRGRRVRRAVARPPGLRHPRARRRAAPLGRLHPQPAVSHGAAGARPARRSGPPGVLEQRLHRDGARGHLGRTAASSSSAAPTTTSARRAWRSSDPTPSPARPPRSAPATPVGTAHRAGPRPSSSSPPCASPARGGQAGVHEAWVEQGERVRVTWAHAA